jgi:DNA polymerase III subunit alpha
MGIRVRPPDVNASAAQFTADGPDIRFGLAAVRNVGAAVVAAILAARPPGGFTSFSDFLRLVPASVCNKRVIESLIKAGAFDSLGHPRRGLMLIHERAVDAVIGVKRNAALGQDSLFGDDEASAASFEVPVPPGDWSPSVRLGFEREMLGRYVSDHPLLGREQELAAVTDGSLAELLAADVAHDPAEDPAGEPAGDAAVRDRDGEVVTVAGILSGVRRKVSRQGAGWASAVLEDLAGAVEVQFFGSVYQRAAALLTDDAIVIVRGRLERAEDGPRLVALDVSPMAAPSSPGPEPVSSGAGGTGVGRAS